MKIEFIEGELEKVSTQILEFLLEFFLNNCDDQELGYIVYHMEDYAYKVSIDKERNRINIEKYLNDDKEVM